jgi:hypothetical protein
VLVNPGAKHVSVQCIINKRISIAHQICPEMNQILMEEPGTNNLTNSEFRESMSKPEIFDAEDSVTAFPSSSETTMKIFDISIE